MSIRVFGKKFIFSAIILITVITACVKPNNTPVITPGTTTIAGIIKAASNLTLLDSALKKANLFSTLDSAAPPYYTVFAPVDIAFTNSQIADSTINSYPDSVLKRILLYHIISSVSAPYYSYTLPQGPNSPIISASGDILYITVNGGYLFVNGNLVTQTDIIAKNGTIQALSGVLLPPLDSTIYQTLNTLSLTTDTTFKFLVAALNRASVSTTYANLVAMLSNPDSVYTILAPTNAAFAAIGDTTISAINNSNADSLARILQCHLLSHRVFSSDFPPSGSLVSIAGDSLAFATTFSLTVLSKGDSLIAANIINVNRLATNGVIHKIDKILLP
jgi:uncharacterized surface protein with fasciclin (FAS1) repeats